MTQANGTSTGNPAGRDPVSWAGPRAVTAFAVLGPLAAAVLLHLAGDRVTAAVSALVLVLVVVAAAASGLRAAGVLAALSAGAWYDFFLTAPRLSFTVLDRDDVEVAVLLLIVGLAVTELALWGRRQQARASRRAGYLDGVLRTADLVALPDASPDLLVAAVAERMTDVLGVDGCRFEARDRLRARSATALHRDGSVIQQGARVDVDRHGLPTDDLVAVPVEHGGVDYGRFLLTSSTRHARPTTEQRRIAVALADQVGARLAMGTGAPGAVRDELPGRPLR
jgi:K+-sensing histidine kinase KdpD